jgi:hypothetical protein
MSVLAVQTTVPGETVFFFRHYFGRMGTYSNKKNCLVANHNCLVAKEKNSHTAAKKKLLPRSSTETETKKKPLLSALLHPVLLQSS